MVLLKGFDERGLVFFTHYTSRKGRELSANPQAALLLYWDALGRQVRVEGELDAALRRETDAEVQQGELSRPDTWGGFRVVPRAWEFWQHRDDRLHDRFRYRVDDDGGWIIERLFP